MIRILMFILAIVAVVLAVVLKEPLLFVIAGGLVLGALLAFVALLRRRHRRMKVQYAPPAREGDDELKALGILEIRPKASEARPGPHLQQEAGVPDVMPAATPEHAGMPGARGGEPPEQERAAEAVPGTGGTPATDDRGIEAEAEEDMVIEVRKKDPERYVAVEAAADGYEEDVLLPVLHALRSALKATTVCLLRQEEIALRYHIVAIVSRNGYARGPGSFSTRIPLLPAGEAPVWVRRVHESDLPAKSLGYYREPIAVRRVAVAPVQGGATGHVTRPNAFFLLADAMDERVFETPRAQALLLRSADLLGVLLDGRLPPSVPASAPRPRREIIAEEMAQARMRRHPLVLALVYLEGGERLRAASEGDIEQAEVALKGQLHEAVPTARIERFGELMYGVFYREPLDDVESWALGLQERLDAAGFDGKVYVGVALLQERHRTPDDFKAEATAALYEAYETGTCTIIES
ncbi:hypothetical protein GQ464_014645 [Rhodocaloribacter litoris]|uniref:hypothetical protein n=1 Tax=Rhodocaloribacter litoris TaxID=2558931 RepID=UPI00141DC989|nr:hypothetical protein [Rhodocaloribacter litoris]QXD14653.1 hypothetical protein GQ464_014645 [Rhodocaloribacter litoris]